MAKKSSMFDFRLPKGSGMDFRLPKNSGSIMSFGLPKTSLGFPFSNAPKQIRRIQTIRRVQSAVPVYSSRERKQRNKAASRRQVSFNKNVGKTWGAAEKGMNYAGKATHEFTSAMGQTLRNAGSWAGEKIRERMEKRKPSTTNHVSSPQNTGKTEIVTEQVGEKTIVARNPEAMEKAKQQIKEGTFKGYI